MAASVDLFLEKGMTFRKQFFYKDAKGAPISLAGYSAKAQIRSTIDSETVILELSTSNGGITLSSTGEINILITAAQTAALTFREAAYDLVLTASNGDKLRLIEGAINLENTVTR